MTFVHWSIFCIFYICMASNLTTSRSITSHMKILLHDTVAVYGVTDWSWCFACRNFMGITLLWIHICFPSIFWVAARYGKKGFFFLSLFIRWVLIQQARKNVNIFSEYLKRVEIGIQPSCPEQLKDWQLSFYPWRNVPWFVTSSHQRQQRGLRNVLRYGIPYHSSQNIQIVHFLITFQKLKEYFINNQGDNMVGLLAKR